MRHPGIIGIILVLSFLCGQQASADTDKVAGEYFRYAELSQPPCEAPIDCAWRDSNGLIIAQGGRLFLLKEESGVWQEIGSLPLRDGFAAASAHGKLYCLEGARLVAVGFDSGKITLTTAAELPCALTAPSILVTGNDVYVIGIDENGQTRFLRRRLTEDASWEELSVPLRQSITRNTLVALLDEIYLFEQAEADGLIRAYRYDRKEGQWRFLSQSPSSLHVTRFSACGDAHILLFHEDSDQIGAYYTATKQWVQIASLPKPARNFAVLSDARAFTLISPGMVVRGEAVLPATKYGFPDHAVVALFFVVMLVVGSVISKREKGGTDYFRARHRVPWWASGLSLFATGASAISLMAMPAKAYTTDWIYWLGGPIQFALLPLALYVILPIARRLQVASAFEYLELRFNVHIRLIGSLIYSTNQILVRMATIMLLPSIAISSICGLPMEVSIIIMGIVTTLYSTMGGLEAVIWTDVIQAFIMLLAMMLCTVWILFSVDSPPSEIWALLQSENKLKLAAFSWDVTQPLIYVIIINNILNICGSLGDQNYIQRVQCTPDEKTARKAIVTQIVVAVPLNACLFGMGTLLYIYYRDHAAMISPAMKADGIFPLFAAQNLPFGLAGIVVAALMAATMSTLSSALNSVANVGIEDYIRPLCRNLSDRQVLLWGKWLTLGLGLFGTGISILLARTSLTSIWDLAILLAGIVYSPMVGIYMLGIFTKRANTVGVAGGVVLAIAMTLFMKNRVVLHPWFFPPISVFTCFISGYIISRLVPLPQRDLAGLTVYSLPKQEDPGRTQRQRQPADLQVQ